MRMPQAEALQSGFMEVAGVGKFWELEFEDFVVEGVRACRTRRALGLEFVVFGFRVSYILCSGQWHSSLVRGLAFYTSFFRRVVFCEKTPDTDCSCLLGTFEPASCGSPMQLFVLTFNHEEQWRAE